MASDESAALQVEFFSMYPDAKLPARASSNLRGSLPSRAVQSCPPVTVASGFGWYVFPPENFAVRWDGQRSEWSLLADNEPTGWRSLDGGHDAKLPVTEQIVADLPARFQADSDIFDYFDGGFSFLDADPRAQNMIELITGTVARTSPGWCLLVRAAPNWPQDRGVQILDGLLETDWYRSLIPTILRLTEPDRIVRFYRELPLMALQPVHRSTLAAVANNPMTATRGIGSWPDDLWQDFVELRRRRQDPTTRRAYLREQRRRARESAGKNRRPADEPWPEVAGPRPAAD